MGEHHIELVVEREFATISHVRIQSIFLGRCNQFRACINGDNPGAALHQTSRQNAVTTAEIKQIEPIKRPKPVDPRRPLMGDEGRMARVQIGRPTLSGTARHVTRFTILLIRLG